MCRIFVVPDLQEYYFIRASFLYTLLCALTCFDVFWCVFMCFCIYVHEYAMSFVPECFK